MTAPFGPKYTTEASSPLDITDAERDRMHHEMARAKLARETYERNQRRYSAGPNLRATPIVPKAVTR